MKTISKIVLATHNKGKIAEIQAMLKPFSIEVISATDFGLPEPAETGSTFAENAVLKAALAAQMSSLPALADDSGLCVNALNGNPGILSARWAGPEKDFSMAMEKINKALDGHSDRSAYFISTLALSYPEGDCEIFEGRIDGTLVWPPRGQNGFGYDAMFMPDGHDKTFGEMTSPEKEKISHRAAAFKQLVEAILVPSPPGRGLG